MHLREDLTSAVTKARSIETETDSAKTAAVTLSLIDLTSLNDDDDDVRIDKLCASAMTPHGPVAAVCLYPQFVARARRRLDGSPVRIATVANFPEGALAIGSTIAMTRQAVADGADDIDVVFPYKTYLSGDKVTAVDLIRATREAAGDRLLKVIFETGQWNDPGLLEEACHAVIDAGADFLKTSTGKTSPGATLDAAAVLITAAQTAPPGSIGIKPAGGIRDVATAAQYLALHQVLRTDVALSPRTFRFGASGLLTAVLAALDGGEDTADLQSIY